MRTFGTFLAVGILALTVGCGDGSPTGIDGGKGAGGGGGGISGSGGAGGVLGGNGGAGGTTSTGACNYPSCVASLAATCAPSGTCVEQSDATTFATNDCYSNGVKVLTTLNLTSGSAVVTYKNGSTTCYSIEAASTNGTTFTLTVKNAAGATIATGTEDDSGTTPVATVTCTGGQAVTLNSACDTSGTSSSASCTTGTCAP